MSTHHSPYQKAFQRYLRTGISIELQFKAEEHLTPQYIWSTMGDDKVRPSHAANEGRIFSWDDPPPTGNPGDEPGCRCVAIPYDPLYPDAIERVYPIETIIVLLRAPELYTAWRAWARIRNVSKPWKLNPNKSPQRWANQMEKGNWTPEKITKFIKEGKQYPARNRTVTPDRNATRYQIGDEFIVVDDVTNEVIQVSRPSPNGFIPNQF